MAVGDRSPDVNKVQAFVEEYTTNGYNATKAYQTIMNKETSRSSANDFLHKPEVQEALRKHQQEMREAWGDTLAAIEEELRKDILTLDANGQHSPTWQKSVELLNKQLGTYTNKVDINSTSGIEINIGNKND